MSGSRFLRLTAAILPFVLVGCGGGGGGAGGGGSASQSTTVQVTVDWAARSRGVGGPSSALSAKLTITGAALDGRDLNFTINRNAAPAAYSSTYTTTDKAKPGSWQVAVRFYAQADAGGALVGTAQKTSVIAADGTGIGTISTTGTVASVTIPAGQSLLVGETKDLSFTALDANNNAIALTPGAAFFLVTTGATKADIVNGQVHGLLPGTPTVTASVDGHVSPAQTILITSNATVTVNPPSASVKIGATQAFTATVTNATDTNVTWSVQEAGGGAIDANGLYTAPATAGTYHVVAVSKYDTAKSSIATVNVVPGVRISPTSATATLRDQKTFVATVTGSANTAVTWSIQEGAAGGTIGSTGVYTAPAAPGIFHIIATSNADTTQKATATVTVEAGGASGTIK